MSTGEYRDRNIQLCDFSGGRRAATDDRGSQATVGVPQAFDQQPFAIGLSIIGGKRRLTVKSVREGAAE